MQKTASTTPESSPVSQETTDRSTQARLPEHNIAIETYECWALACLSSSGEVLHATPIVQKTLDAVCNPQLPCPVRRMDPLLLGLIRQAIDNERNTQSVTLLRRDGVLSHFTALTRTCKCPSGDAIGLLFLPAVDEAEDLIDEAWLPLLRALPPQESA